MYKQAYVLLTSLNFDSHPSQWVICVNSEHSFWVVLTYIATVPCSCNPLPLTGTKTPESDYQSLNRSSINQLLEHVIVLIWLMRPKRLPLNQNNIYRLQILSGGPSTCCPERLSGIWDNFIYSILLKYDKLNGWQSFWATEVCLSGKG